MPTSACFDGIQWFTRPYWLTLYTTSYHVLPCIILDFLVWHLYYATTHWNQNKTKAPQRHTLKRLWVCLPSVLLGLAYCRPVYGFVCMCACVGACVCADRVVRPWVPSLGDEHYCSTVWLATIFMVFS